MSRLRDVFAPYWLSIQTTLFPWLDQALGPLTAKQQQVVQTLEIIRVEDHLPQPASGPGRPRTDRAAIARAFTAKAVYDLPTTRMLLDRLATDVTLRRICGWERKGAVPSEAVFSRAFAEFATAQLSQRVHEALIQQTHHDRLVGHLSRDSTAIVAREKPAPKDPPPAPPTRKRGRPKKGEERPPAPPPRLQRQGTMTKQELLADLPTACDGGTKKNSKGYKETWIGYKLHIDVADAQIPISCGLTAASVHDSPAAIPLATLSAECTNLYDVMDAAYDAQEIRAHSCSLDHVPLIDLNPRRNTALKDELTAEAQRRQVLGVQLPEDVRYNERTAVERVNARLKDEFGARHVRVRGAAKVMCHCMFGVLALTADQLMRLLT